MSLNRLLTFVPFARRLGSVSDREEVSAATMIFRALNRLAAVWCFMLLVSTAVLLIFALLTPRVAFYKSPGARDAEIHSIQSVTDIGLLQHKAALDVSEGYATGATATFLCHVALWTFMLINVASIGGLLLIRWMKWHLSPDQEDTDT